MWAKDDEVRALLKGAVEALAAAKTANAGALRAAAALVLGPAVAAVEEMIFKEEQILLPMSLDALTETEWRLIAQESAAIGWPLTPHPPAWGDPSARAESGVDPAAATAIAGIPVDGVVRFPSGSLSVSELTRVLNLLPFDLTFVDAEDEVRYFTQGGERIFDRNVAILGRKVQQCHPPASVHIVQQIVDDFRAGRAHRAPFWIELHGKFIHIEYFAVRDETGRYLGTLEVSQDLTSLRALRGEQRLISYAETKEVQQ
jgi:uncharacterized protein